MLLSIHDLQIRLMSLDIDLSKSYTSIRHSFDTDVIDTINSLFLTTDYHRKTLVFLLINQIDPTTYNFKCKCCGCNITKNPSNGNMFKILYCSKSCSQRHRRIIDPEYQIRLVNKAKIKHSFVDPSTGLTSAKIGAIKTAEIKRLKNSYVTITNKIVESNRRTFEKRVLDKHDRLIKILNRRGIKNFIRFMLRNRKFKPPITKNISIKTILKHIDFCKQKLKFDISSIDVVKLWSDITGNSMHKECKECGNLFQYRTFDANWNFTVFTNTKYCSDNCCYVHYKKTLAVLPKRTLTDEQKKEIGKASKLAHAKYPEMGKAVSVKALETMRIEGTLTTRRDKALQTKLERGIISEIRFDKKSSERSEYMRYNKKVWSLTKTQPLHTLKNFDKRGKKTWHLDHIFPTSIAYVLDIPVELIGDIDNLTMLEASENIKKSNKIYEIPLKIFNYIVENNKLDELEKYAKNQ